MDAANREPMMERFKCKLSDVIQNKKENSDILTKEKYSELVDKVKESKSKSSDKTPVDYQILCYLEMGECDKFIYPVNEESCTIR